ncbi:MAG: acetyl-CoA carboxylase biotin carboxyl carrier protein subunit [Bacteroidales bacterium]|jgi:biotin carboxyl carrier protein|nr:acetyl-CoA carboxylase biotin carboxyl carrier protein subunit [Bacteroidales bacterium]
MKEYKFKVSGKDYTVSVDNAEENIVNLTVNGTKHVVELEEKTIETPVVAARPAVQRPVAASPTPATAGNSGKPLKSPLPGVILDLYVKVGDAVKNGQKVLLLEAMKMENNIDSDRDGVVKDIKVGKGDSVNEGDVLLIIE